MSSDVVVHQTLHGYAGGHQLLQASIKLSSDAQRTMLALSDLSGSDQAPGFDSYLTGYPLAGTEFYAIARTWLALEMPRPGCVWTHSLLFDASALAEVIDARGIAEFFRRPDKVEDGWAEYSSALVFSSGDKPFLNDDQQLFKRSAHLLEALYENPHVPVWMAGVSSHEYEGLILAIWSQQWPDLRRSFTFCSGSLSPRFLDSRPFDLQIAPSREVQRWTRSLAEHRRVEMAADEPRSAWALFAANDLIQQERTALRDFLRRYGGEAMDGRQAFADMVALFLDIEDVRHREKALSALTATVARAFPMPTSGRELKVALYGTPHGGTAIGASESELLLELATTPYIDSLDLGFLNIRQRAVSLWRQDATSAVELLLRVLKGRSEAVRLLLAGAAEAATPEEFARYCSQAPRLRDALVSIRVELATSPELWTVSNEQQQRLLRAVKKGSISDPEVVAELVRAMLVARADGVADAALDTWGASAIDAALRWLEEHPPTPGRLSPTWRDALAARPDELTSWLESHETPQPTILAMLAEFLVPHVNRLSQLTPSDWLPLVRDPTWGSETRAYMKVQTFLLALGLGSGEKGAHELTAFSFEPVHDAIAEGRLPQELWKLLEPHLPPAGLFWDWDKCERLRRAFVERLLRFKWPGELVLTAAREKSTFERVVKRLRSSDEGRRLVRQLAERVHRGDLQGSEVQRTVLSHALR